MSWGSFFIGVVVGFFLLPAILALAAMLLSMRHGREQRKLMDALGRDEYLKMMRERRNFLLGD